MGNGFYVNNNISEEPELPDIVKEDPEEGRVRIIPLGGIGEIGKNLTLFETRTEIIVVDAGIMFPSEDMPGIDFIIPDIRYLIYKKDKIKAIFLTHGHEDHIGALTYLLPQIDVPVYGSQLTIELVRSKLSDREADCDPELIPVRMNTPIQTDTFTIKFYPVIHSIAESAGLIIDTPAGRIIHSGDFKFDFTQNAAETASFLTHAGFDEKKTKLLLSDSTNAEKQGFSIPESTVKKTLEKLFAKAEGRIIISSFASSLPRIREIITLAQKFGRKICILGRGFETTINIAKKLGYITAPSTLFIDTQSLATLPDDKILIMATGTQGEPMSAISSIAGNAHKWVKIRRGDKVILSSTPIPGNEALVYKNINSMIKQGADVVYENPYLGKDNFHVHASGHGSQEDLKLLISITNPEYIMPVHGEVRHQVSYRRMAKKIGYKDDKIIIAENGSVIEMSEAGVEEIATIPTLPITIDGYGIGDVGKSVIKERLALAENGICVVSGMIDLEKKLYIQGPFINSMGLVFEKEAEELLEAAEEHLVEVTQQSDVMCIEDLNILLKSEIKKFFAKKIRRKPAVIPVILEYIEA